MLSGGEGGGVGGGLGKELHGRGLDIHLEQCKYFNSYSSLPDVYNDDVDDVLKMFVNVFEKAEFC